mgnify:CR=1 FL=1
MLARPALPLIAVVLLSGCPKNLKLPDLSAYTPKVRFDRVDLPEETERSRAERTQRSRHRLRDDTD